jgi:hypothetical protein
VNVPTPALARLAQRNAPAPPILLSPQQEQCDLCAGRIPAQHRHLFDLESRQVLCSCQACRILFSSGAAGGVHYRLIPERRLRIADFRLDDAEWEHLRIPVNVAFFSWSSVARRMVAMYPGALGAAESALGLATWAELAAVNPGVSQLAPDVEALLVYRAKEPHQHYLVPIDDCYRLTGIIRTQWKGFTGGNEVWRAIDAFFEELASRATTINQGS